MIKQQESVKVVVRVRPFNQKQQLKSIHHIHSDNNSIIEVDQKQKQIVLKKNSDYDKQIKLFCFDDIFDTQQDQSDVYQSTAHSLIQQVIEGYNGTIFAYGQTGSGKTYTMMGNIKEEDQQGIIPRSFQQLMTCIKQISNKNFLIQCSYIQIYNEQIHDLLSINLKNKLEIRESPEKGIFIKDLRKNIVKNVEQMSRYLTVGNSNRTVAETLMNLQSSRSHAIFTVYVQTSQTIDEHDRFTASKLNLVDLAGSERQSKTGSTGDRLKQASKINLSLSALGNVISALVDGKGNHIPYRDSKLTRLLQDSLGGNTKTIMIANISPSAFNYQQTLSTLKYASRAKYIQNVPIINEDPKDALLREYQNEIKKLRTMLKDLQETERPHVVNKLQIQKQQFQKQLEDQKEELLNQIKQLQEQLIHPSKLQEKLLQERNKRQQQLSFMQKNYKNLEEEVEQMRELLKQLRRKYKIASKQIFELQKEHEQEKGKIMGDYNAVLKQNIVNKAVLSILFSEKQYQNLISLGEWEDQETFKLPPFYFKDKSTLAFPYQQNNNKKQVIQQSAQEINKKNKQNSKSSEFKKIVNVYKKKYY